MESNKREKEIQSRRTLLIADDDEISGDILASFFEKDYDILRAYTGRETLQAISSHLETIDLVLLDIYMPDLDGFHVLKERQNPVPQFTVRFRVRKIPMVRIKNCTPGRRVLLVPFPCFAVSHSGIYFPQFFPDSR